MFSAFLVCAVYLLSNWHSGGLYIRIYLAFLPCYPNKEKLTSCAPKSYTAACWHWPASGPILAHDPAAGKKTVDLCLFYTYCFIQAKGWDRGDQINQSINQNMFLVSKELLPSQRVRGDYNSSLRNKSVGRDEAQRLNEIFFCWSSACNLKSTFLEFDAKSIQLLSFSISRHATVDRLIDRSWSTLFFSRRILHFTCFICLFANRNVLWCHVQTEKYEAIRGWFYGKGY